MPSTSPLFHFNWPGYFFMVILSHSVFFHIFNFGSFKFPQKNKQTNRPPVGILMRLLWMYRLIWGEQKLSRMKTSGTKASYVSPFVHAFLLFPFIKGCNFLHIGPTNAQFLKALYRGIAISSKAKAWNTLSLAPKMDPYVLWTQLHLVCSQLWAYAKK